MLLATSASMVACLGDDDVTLEEPRVDGGGAVGDYTAPHALGGKVENVSVAAL